MRTTRLALAAVLTLPSLALAQRRRPAGPTPRREGLHRDAGLLRGGGPRAPRPLRRPARRRRDRRHGRGGPAERGSHGPGGAAPLEGHAGLHPPLRRDRGHRALRADAARAGGEAAGRGVRQVVGRVVHDALARALPGPPPARHRPRHRRRGAGRRRLHRLEQHPGLEEPRDGGRRHERHRARHGRDRHGEDAALLPPAGPRASGRGGTRSSR